MNEKEFIFWLKGYTDNIRVEPTREQWDYIRTELSLMFNKVTPYRPNTQPFGSSEIAKLGRITPGIFSNIPMSC